MFVLLSLSPHYDTRFLRTELLLLVTDKSLVNEHIKALKNYYGLTQLNLMRLKHRLRRRDTKEPISTMRRAGRLLYVKVCPLLPSQAVTATDEEDKC